MTIYTDYTIRTEMQGHRFGIKVESNEPYNEKREMHWTRGKVEGFSRKSRKRLLDYLASIEFRNLKVVFITLTYPKKFPSPQDAKKHLRAFNERIRRIAPNASAIWRMEFQQRGAPHFHLMVFNLPYWNKEDVQRAWGEIIDFDQPFTRIELIRSWRKAMSYVSKYIAKEETPALDGGFNYLPYLHAGRLWGWFQKEKIPWAVLYELAFNGLDKRYFDMRRQCRRIWRGLSVRSAKQGFTIYHDNPKLLSNLLEHTFFDGKLH